MSEDVGSNIAPESNMGVAKNAAPPDGYVRLWTRSGQERLVRIEDYDAAHTEGLIDVEYDPDTAYGELLAAWDAARSCIVKFHEGQKALGYVGPEDASVCNIAAWTARDCFNHYVTAVSARVPEEAHVAALAEHLSRGFEVAPAHKGMEEAARAYPPEKLAAFITRNEEENARRDALIAAEAKEDR